MTTNQPSSAPAINDDAGDDRTAAAVLHDDQLDAAPGGGGLGSRVAGAVPARTGGEAANAPVSTGTVADPDLPGGKAEREAQARSLEDGEAGLQPLPR